MLSKTQEAWLCKGALFDTFQTIEPGQPKSGLLSIVGSLWLHSLTANRFEKFTQIICSQLPSLKLMQRRDIGLELQA